VRKAWNKGKKLSEIHIANLSLSHLGVVSRPAKPRICSNCNSEYYTKNGGSRRKNRKYCSFECYKQSAIGRYKPLGFGNYRENNCNWRGGVTKENKIIRNSRRYADWRNLVFKRDNFTCQNCNANGVYLEADHIKPFAYFNELRFELSNGRTLCKPCHAKTDTYMGRARQKNKELQTWP